MIIKNITLTEKIILGAWVTLSFVMLNVFFAFFLVFLMDTPGLPKGLTVDSNRYYGTLIPKDMPVTRILFDIGLLVLFWVEHVGLASFVFKGKMRNWNPRYALYER